MNIVLYYVLYYRLPLPSTLWHVFLFRQYQFHSVAGNFSMYYIYVSDSSFYFINIVIYGPVILQNRYLGQSSRRCCRTYCFKMQYLWNNNYLFIKLFLKFYIKEKQIMFFFVTAFLFWCVAEFTFSDFFIVCDSWTKYNDLI